MASTAAHASATAPSLHTGVAAAGAGTPLSPSAPAPREMLRLAIVYAVAINGTILTPFIVSSLMLRFGLDEGQGTMMTGFEMLGMAFSCMLLPHWVARYASRFARIGVCGTVAMQVASALLATTQAVSVARGLAGVFEGMLFMLVAARVARQPSAERIWGVIVLIGGLVNGALLIGISYLPERWAAQWLFLAMAALVVCTAPVLLQAGRAIVHDHADQKKSSDTGLPWLRIAAVWLLTILIYGVQAGQWAVTELAGQHAGLATSTIGILLSLSSFLGFLGCVASSLRGSHRHRRMIIVAAQLLMTVSVMWFFSARTGGAYFTSQLLLNVGFYALTPFLTGLLSEIDADGSLVSRTVVVTLVGVAVGTTVAGWLLTALGPAHFGMVLGIAVLLGIPLVAIAFAPGKRVRIE
ncbi:Permeases of the major facilitator superfamily [Collimonas arenae]|uniref:Permeases of the major facilitator superfamily n=1 Tax=Collimonas arenae TaxID=279058 RepID=A0A0A1F6R1_9BURK|nr:MFS transporter [Collimonas arenae]AIY39359.1 Permeases of the major facilitator superfamily [Collimonas arenae]